MTEKNMERTQIYLPRGLKRGLSRLAAKKHSNVSALLREAGESLLEREKQALERDDQAFKKALDNIAGIWADRDPNEFEATRKSFDRKFPGWND